MTESSDTETSPAIRTLLWSPFGSGVHYHGPGSFAYRMYSRAPKGRFAITLAHGRIEQPSYELFSAQHLVAPYNGRQARMLAFVSAGRRWLRNHAGGFDVLHGLGAFHTTVSPAYAAERLGLPAVVFVANSGVELADKPGLKRLLGLPRRRRRMARHLSAIIAMSEAINEELLDMGIAPDRIARIPMGVDAELFHPETDEHARSELRRAAGWPDLPTFIFVGSVTRRKQPHLMVEAIAFAAKRGIDCQLVLAGPEGEPEYSAELRSLAEELGVTSRVVWNGFTEDVSPLLRASDVFGLVSSREGMSAAVVEAMASGLPSIVTDVSGMRDLIDDGLQGRIVEPSAEHVAEALVGYLEHPARRDEAGRAARLVVEQRYSLDAVVSAYEQLFRRIMAGQPAAG